jgi:hypothetical protein
MEDEDKGAVDPGNSHGGGPQIKALPRKLRSLIAAIGMNEPQFCEDFCASQKVIDRRTPHGWLSEAAEEPSAHQPSKTNRERIARYFREKLEIETFPMSLLYCELADFEKLLAEARQKRSLPYLHTPLSHRLRRFSDANIALLSGKYLLYRQTFRDTGDIVAEIFTLSGGEAVEHLNIKLYSYVVSSEEEPEIFEGKFFRYGDMFMAVITFSNAQNVHHMRIMHFPEVAYPEGVYGGLVSGYSKSSREAVAVRAIARRIDDKPFEPKTDKERVRLIREDEPGLEKIRAYLNNQLKDDQHVLSSDNSSSHLRRLF